MKVLSINGSPRENGSTNHVIDKIIEGIIAENVVVKKYCLSNIHINYCIGCKSCYQTGSCIHKDDVQNIILDLIDSDLVIIGSPSYWGDITGQLKVFIDRNTPYSDTNKNANKLSIPKNIKGISVAIRAGETERENNHIIETIEHYFGHLGIISVGKIGITGVDTINDLINKPAFLNEAVNLGKKINHIYQTTNSI